MTPHEAFEEASAILVNQYTALSGSTVVEAAPTLGQEQVDDMNELNTSIEELNLTARTANALVNNDIKTVHDLVTLTDQELRDLKGFGSKALDEVKDKLAELEL
jgi:DNA-directed RNA polymerase subunit alpha